MSSPSVVKVYGTANSSCTARVLTCLEEKGAVYELVPINIPAGDHLKPGYLTFNPFRQIPAMEDGDLKLFESRAISKYIARKYDSQGPDLLHDGDPASAATVEVWMEAEAQSYSPAVSALVFQLIIVPYLRGGKPDQAVVDANAAALGRVLDVYEQRLGETKYLAGDTFSLADLHHLPYTYYLMTTDLAGLINSRPRVKAWWEDISSRPAFKKVAAKMDLHG